MTLTQQIEEIVSKTPITDIHTHLYDPALGELLLWGIDDLLVYHYLVAEAFRYLELPYETFHRLSKARQADLIWEKLFVAHSPISEACRGVITTLNRLGLDVKRRDLPSLRKWFAAQKFESHLGRCLAAGGVHKVYMTNSPFDDAERPAWEKGFARDERFVAALRLDPLMLAWPETAGRLRQWGYEASAELTTKTQEAVRRFLENWTRRLQARYLMVSLPPDFEYLGPRPEAKLLQDCVLPFCRETNLPLALMLGARRALNPGLRAAGDGVGRSELSALGRLCAENPSNKFLVTVLSRENQHELCVLARKFRNLHLFGCWWFTNIPTVVTEMTRMRLELLGLSFTPQHSDARVLEHLVYKWPHFRQVLVPLLAEKYGELAASGWEIRAEEISRDVKDLLGGAFEAFCQQSF